MQKPTMFKPHCLYWLLADRATIITDASEKAVRGVLLRNKYIQECMTQMNYFQRIKNTQVSEPQLPPRNQIPSCMK